MPTDNLIKSMLEEELDRNLRAQKAYKALVGTLPKGSIKVMRRNKKAYCYLRYRVGNKVKTDYAGKADVVEVELREKIAQRNTAMQELRQLKKEQLYIEKALKK